MINFLKKKKNRKQRRNEPRCYTIEDAIKKLGSRLRDNIKKEEKTNVDTVNINE